MRFVKAGIDEFLVVARGGKLRDRGLAGSALLWPGQSAVVVTGRQEEACFEMTQESRDGIPLRFKGIVLYRVVDPAAVAARFDFSTAAGSEQIRSLLGHVCLGELRATVSAMTMQQCIEERKTTLSDAVATSLRQVTGEVRGGDSWGLALDVVQVAQVFIVDQELRRKLEAELRNEVTARSALSDLRTQEQLQRARAASERRLRQEALDDERDKARAARETHRLEQ